MIFIITGALESSRNTVGNLLAEALGWEFVDAENLSSRRGPASRGCSTANAIPTLLIDTVSTAIHSWIYEWRDIVLSCPVLTEANLGQLSRMSSLIKIVCLDELQERICTGVSDRSCSVANSPSLAASHVSRDPPQIVFSLDLSRPVEAIVAELTAVLMK